MIAVILVFTGVLWAKGRNVPRGALRVLYACLGAAGIGLLILQAMGLPYLAESLVG